MTTLPAPLVEIHTRPDDVPSVPVWFAEVILLARHFTQRGVLDAIAEHVRLARGRACHYAVLDFVTILLGYALSGEPTLEAFFDRLHQFASPFMALFGRDQLPHRSTLSRFLADVDATCLEALRQQFDHDRRDIRPAGRPQRIQECITQCRQGLRCVADTHLVGILAHWHVAHVMPPMLTGPMSVPHLLNDGTRHRRRKTRNSIRDRLRDCASFARYPFTCPSDHLLAPRSVQIVVKIIATHE